MAGERILDGLIRIVAEALGADYNGPPMDTSISSEYERKLTTYEALIKGLKSPLVAATGNAGAKANKFFLALSEYGDHIDDITLGLTNTYEEDYPIVYRKGVKVITGFLGPLERRLVKTQGNVSYRPTQFCDGKRALDSGRPGPSVYILVTGPMGEDGNFNLGVSSGLEYDSIKRYGQEPGTKVVVVANVRIPHIMGLEEHGGQRFHLSEVDQVIEADEPVREMPRQEPMEGDAKIADHVANLVEDRSTVQFGIGALPDLVAERLKSKKGLGIHTEMIGDGCMELIRSGAVTNENKSEHRGCNTATFVLGSRALYDWADRNESLRLLPVHQVNSPVVLARQYKMTSMNSILQIDLRGQATAHCLNGKSYSGLGGHLEHTYGAQLSPGGKSILCLRASTMLKDGLVSNVVVNFAPGTGVTTPEFIIDWVATEYGAVQLKWLTLKDRARALIGLAHPNFRDALEKEASEFGSL